MCYKCQLREFFSKLFLRIFNLFRICQKVLFFFKAKKIFFFFIYIFIIL